MGDSVPAARSARAVFEGIIELGPRDLKRVAQLKGLGYTQAIRAFHNSVAKFGVRVLGGANNEMLGLVLTFFEVKPTEPYRDVLFDSFSSLRSLSYLGVDMTDLSTLFGLVYVPASASGHVYLSLFEKLKERGLISSYRTHVAAKRLRYSVRPECIDWSTGKYSFEWADLKDRVAEDTVFELSESVLADYVDLLIIKELESDATISLSEISNRLLEKHQLKVSERLLLYHFTRHLVGHKLLSRYKVFFPLANSISAYIIVRVKASCNEQYAKLVRRIPFLSIELFTGGDSVHISSHNIPLDHLPGFVSYVQKKLRPLVSGLDIKMSIQGLRYAYTIPFELFDIQTGMWKYDAETDAQQVAIRAQELLSSVRQREGKPID